MTESATKVVETHENYIHNQPEYNEEQFDQNNFSDFNDMAS